MTGISTCAEYTADPLGPPRTLPEPGQVVSRKPEQIRTNPNTTERPSAEIRRPGPHNRRTIPSRIVQNRPESSKIEQADLKKPEKTESRNRRIFSLLLNFAPFPSPEKKFPEKLKPRVRSRSTEHAIPLHG